MQMRGAIKRNESIDRGMTRMQISPSAYFLACVETRDAGVYLRCDVTTGRRRRRRRGDNIMRVLHIHSAVMECLVYGAANGHFIAVLSALIHARNATMKTSGWMDGWMDGSRHPLAAGRQDVVVAAGNKLPKSSGPHLPLSTPDRRVLGDPTRWSTVLV